MFVHNLKYAFKTMLKNKTAIIWTLLFPIVLGTFMHMAFSEIYEAEAIFTEVPVAVVKDKENESFEMMLDELSKEGDEQLLVVKYMDEEKANKALEDEEVIAIIHMGDELELTVASNSYESTVVETVMNEYKKQEIILTDIATNHPENLAGAIENLVDSKSFYTEKKTTDGNQNMITNFIYAVFAMSCLFGSFGAIEKIGKMQGNVSALGMRRCLSPNSKMISIVAEFVSMIVFQTVVQIIALIYFVILGVDFGSKYVQIIGVLFFGSCIGVAFGIIIGSISKISENTKSGICISISMVLSGMADLYSTGVKDAIEHKAPIINRLNPAALISDSFYALNVYDTNERYLGNLAILCTMTIVLLIVSYLMLRRNKYASV